MRLAAPTRGRGAARLRDEIRQYIGCGCPAINIFALAKIYHSPQGEYHCGAAAISLRAATRRGISLAQPHCAPWRCYQAMDWLRQWALALCSASAVSAAVSLLCPEDRFERVMKLAVSAFLLLLVVSPLARLEDCSLEVPALDAGQYCAEESDLGEYVTGQACRMAAEAAAGVIGQRLSEYGIFAQEILVCTDSSPDGCISIGQVTVILTDTDTAAHSEVSRLLREVLGLEDTVVTGGTDG